MPDILAPRALSDGRIGALGASADFCHGLLALLNLDILNEYVDASRNYSGGAHFAGKLHGCREVVASNT